MYELVNTTPKRVSLVRSHTVTYAILFSVIALLTLGSLVYSNYEESMKAPEQFPVGEEIVITEGQSIKTIASNLEAAHVINSKNSLRIFLSLNHPDTHIQANVYTFTEPTDLPRVVDAITNGTHLAENLRATFPEGFRIRDMSMYTEIPIREEDIAFALTYEGFLFPDTYHISKDTSFDELLVLMQATYEVKVAPLRSEIAAQNMKERDVIILASILEREANDEISMKLVSGILHNRLKKGMPLQVDAVFDYLLGKGSHDLTRDDLDIDSPYNTYENTGLPPTPIANPGLVAINAVLFPTPSSYLYYLTDNDGIFHYAKTFEEHKKNKERYLR